MFKHINTRILQYLLQNTCYRILHYLLQNDCCRNDSASIDTSSWLRLIRIWIFKQNRGRVFPLNFDPFMLFFRGKSNLFNFNNNKNRQFFLYVYNTYFYKRIILWLDYEYELHSQGYDCTVTTIIWATMNLLSTYIKLPSNFCQLIRLLLIF